MKRKKNKLKLSRELSKKGINLNDVSTYKVVKLTPGQSYGSIIEGGKHSFTNQSLRNNW